MWFKNIHLYRFEEPFTRTGQQLHAALEKRAARACGQMELSCEGWAKPLGLAGQMLVHETDGRLMFCLRREDKVLPASVVREALESKVFRIEQEEGRAVGRKEKMDIKDQIIQEVLPRALVRASHTYAYIDPKNGWLVVNAASAKKADELTTLLRKTLDTLNVVLPQTDLAPDSAMTQWLMDDTSLPEGFTVEDACEMHAAGESDGVIRCRHIEVASEEVRAHVRAGHKVRKLAMNWQEKISFVLHEDLSVRSMRFDAALLDEADEAGDDEAARFDADFAIMGAELAQFIPQLLGALGTKENG